MIVGQSTVLILGLMTLSSTTQHRRLHHLWFMICPQPQKNYCPLRIDSYPAVSKKIMEIDLALGTGTRKIQNPNHLLILVENKRIISKLNSIGSSQLDRGKVEQRYVIRIKKRGRWHEWLIRQTASSQCVHTRSCERIRRAGQVQPVYPKRMWARTCDTTACFYSWTWSVDSFFLGPSFRIRLFTPSFSFFRTGILQARRNGIKKKEWYQSTAGPCPLWDLVDRIGRQNESNIYNANYGCWI